MQSEEELLKVLGMTEEEQKRWVYQYCDINRIDNTRLIPHPDLGCDDYEIEISLADLAFRLRDEVACMEYWWNGILKVYQKCKADFIEAHVKLVPEVAELGAASQWYANFAQPIHWIIAALIAKLEADNAE